MIHRGGGRRQLAVSLAEVEAESLRLGLLAAATHRNTAAAG
jgi:hypothetical protein